MLDKAIAIKKMSFYDLMTEEQKEDILNNSQIRLFKKGDVIANREIPCMGPFLIIEGEVRAVMSVDDEKTRDVSLFKLGAGDMALLSAACVLEYILFDAKFVVEKDTEALAIKADVAKKIMDENISVRCAFFETLADRFSSSMLTINDILFTKYEKRVASFLIERQAYTGDTEIKITQEEIAQMTNSAREVAGRTIRQFAQDSLVEYSRGKIKILDLNGLKDLV